jgi:hypothetical protein
MRAPNLGKIGVSLYRAVSFTGVSSLSPPCFIAILISRVQPLRLIPLGPSCGTRVLATRNPSTMTHQVLILSIPGSGLGRSPFEGYIKPAKAH